MSEEKPRPKKPKDKELKKSSPEEKTDVLNIAKITKKRTDRS